MGVIIAVNTAIIKHANYFLHCSCFTSNGFVYVPTAALLILSVFAFPTFFFLSNFCSLSLYPSIILCHSLAALALSAAPHPLAGL